MLGNDAPGHSGPTPSGSPGLLVSGCFGDALVLAPSAAQLCCRRSPSLYPLQCISQKHFKIYKRKNRSVLLADFHVLSQPAKPFQRTTQSVQTKTSEDDEPGVTNDVGRVCAEEGAELTGHLSQALLAANGSVSGDFCIRPC